MFQIYKPSGRLGPLTFPLLAIGIVVVIALAFVYQLLLDVIPLIYVNFLITLGAGTAIGFIGSTIVKRGKVRNVPVAAVCVSLLIVSFLGAKFWFQYQTFLRTTVDAIMVQGRVNEENRGEVEQAVGEEFSFQDHIQERVETGWNVGRRGNGAPLNGIFVYLIWLIEAGAIVYMAFSPPLGFAREPFSEKFNQWADEVQVVMTLPITDHSMVERIKSTSSIEGLLDIPIPQTDQAAEFAVYTVNSIAGEEQEDAYLSVSLMSYFLNKEGQQETKFKPLVNSAILTAAQRAQLMENASLLKEAMEDYRASLAAEEEQAALSSSETDTPTD